MWACLLMEEVDVKANVCPLITSVTMGSAMDQRSCECALVDKGRFLFL
jgi:hypothetical protein